MPLKVAIIGAGVSGLTACKEMLAVQLDVTVYERSNRVGGLWAYTEDPGTPTVMRQTVLNLSKAQMTFSDFPFPREYPDYMSHQAYESYLEEYAAHFNILDKIRFNTSVTTVKPLADGRWNVASVTGGEAHEEIFDRVIVAAGQNQTPNIPATPGLDQFQGIVGHSLTYKSFEPYVNKNVLVVGVANSGADVAVDLSGNAKKVYLSGRRGIWLLPRHLLFGKPYDHLYSRTLLKAPGWFINTLIKMMSRLMVGNLYRFGIGTAIRPTDINPVVNDSLGERLATGKVMARPDISKIYSNQVEFADGRKEDIDAIIYCTGFQRSFSFLPSLSMTGQPEPGSQRVSLYKRMIPLSYPNLAFVGHFHGLSHSAVSELQARWVARYFIGEIILPSDTEMQREINEHEIWTEQNVHGKIKTTEIPAFGYMEMLAKEIGCTVDTKSLWWDRPVLRNLVLYGRFCPHQYRLFGPDRWGGAEEEIYWTCGVRKGIRSDWIARLW